MKIECVQDKLQKAVSQTERITGKHMTLPILNCILLETNKNSLIIRATNLDLSVEVTIPVRVVKQGKVAVPGTLFNQFISSLTNSKSVTFEVIENNLHISTEEVTTVIKSHPVDDFPTIPEVPEDNSFTINPEDFVKGLRSVWYAASVSSIKSELSSVYIYSEDEHLVFVATDSFRLAEKKVRVKKIKDIGTLLIPFKNIPEIIKILESLSGEVTMSVTKNQISFKKEGLYATSRIVDGIFPDYKQIIPKESTSEVTLLKQDLINALKVANIFSDKFNQIHVEIEPKGKIFSISTKNSDVGEHLNKLSAVIEGEKLEINFNYKYIIDCFQSIDSDSVSLHFNGLNRPMVVRGVSDKTFLYLVMPMNN